MNTPNRTSAHSVRDSHYDRDGETARIAADWATNSRWDQVSRPYTADDVVRLRGSLRRDHTIARRGAEKLWDLLQTLQSQQGFTEAAAALSGAQAVQQVEAGIRSVYLSSRHSLPSQKGVTAHTNETLRPDQSLYASASIPALARRINNAFERADQLQWKAGIQPGNPDYTDRFAPIIADAQTDCGGVLNAYELTQNMIRAGAAGVHFEDPLATNFRGDIAKLLIPTEEAVQKLIAARLAADVEDVPTLILARVSADATLLSSDSDSSDRPFATDEHGDDGLFEVRADIDHAIARGLACAPYADVLWLETAGLDLDSARKFAAAIRREYPRQLLAYHCTSTSAGENRQAEDDVAALQRELAAMGYLLQFIAPADTAGSAAESNVAPLQAQLFDNATFHTGVAARGHGPAAAMRC